MMVEPDRCADWRQYRDQVLHPASVYKPADLQRARENVTRHAWARRVLEGMQAGVAATLAASAEHVVRMIPATTPGGLLFTNCPVCEGNTIHGSYDWDPREPEQLVCTTCRTVYPNDRYPEDIAFRAERHGNGQTITYHGGYAFEHRGFALRSSWTAQIRARKVAHMASQAQMLATVYALTGERRCAEQTRAILLRFAEVYPHYLVHSSYGEWIDLPPHRVAGCINDLPEDEWTIAPNRPDRKLHSGYWNSGRATGSGMEGGFIRHLALAYDLIHAVLSEEERLQIERDLLIEGTILLLADPALNKSVGNLSAAGLVGMVVGDPGLVRAGAKGFWYFAREWFLPDGTTSESPAYGLMTLNGMWSFGEALHGYSDPPGYRAADRIDACDVYADRRYRAVFRALYDTLLPNLNYPASADSYVPTSLGVQYAELMAARYNLPEYRALLQEKLDGPVAEMGGEYALFHRDPEFAVSPEDRIAFGDTFFPALRMAYLRSGTAGRGGVAILNASHWGVHHHRDSLNLTLFEHGHELLTDLGYLWDRPDKEMTVRTPAHNLVVIDEAEQRTTERGGSLHFFDVTPHVKAVECSSATYAQAPLYRRLCVRVDHGAEGSYLLDLFRVAGGTIHDYLFHGPHRNYSVAGAGIGITRSPEPAPYGLHHLWRGASTAAWRLRWSLPETEFSAWALPVEREEVLVGDGWGERGWGHFNTPDKKVEVPYVIRRRAGDALASTFVTVFEAHGEEPLVAGVELVQTVGDAIVVEVQRVHGADIIVAALTSEPRTLPTSRGLLETDGTLTIVSTEFLYLAGGTRARCGERQVALPAGRLSGAILEIANGDADSYLVVDGLPESAVADVVGRTVLVDDGTSTTGYPVQHAAPEHGTMRLYTRRNGQGYDVQDGKVWTILLSGYGIAAVPAEPAGGMSPAGLASGGSGRQRRTGGPTSVEREDDLAVFKRRLAETIAWCTPRLAVADPKNSLRTPLLRPPHLLQTPTELAELPAKGLSAEEWAATQRERERTRTDERVRQEAIAARIKYAGIARERQAVVRELAEERARLLGLANRYPRAPAQDLAGGRLLICEDTFSVWDAASESESEGFFDEVDVPPWDTWLCYVIKPEAYDLEAIRRMSAQEVRSGIVINFESFLVSWVPPQLIGLADRGIEINCVNCIDWVSNYPAFLKQHFA